MIKSNSYIVEAIYINISYLKIIIPGVNLLPPYKGKKYANIINLLVSKTKIQNETSNSHKHVSYRWIPFLKFRCLLQTLRTFFIILNKICLSVFAYLNLNLQLFT